MPDAPLRELTADEVAAFARDGVVCARGLFPRAWVERMAKAVDRIVGGEELTPTAEKMRRLMHHGQFFQSHALHFFHLASPDLLFGFEADPETTIAKVAAATDGRLFARATRKAITRDLDDIAAAAESGSG